MPKFKYSWHRKNDPKQIHEEIEAEDLDDAHDKIKELWGGHDSERGGLRVLDLVTAAGDEQADQP